LPGDAAARAPHEEEKRMTTFRIHREPEDAAITNGVGTPSVATPAAQQDGTSAVDRLVGGVVAGLAAGAAMYVALAVAALTQGRSALYPAYAVHALMTGGRVLPDHPNPSLEGRHPADLLVGPLLFLLPAVVVAVLVSWWLGRPGGARRDARRGHRTPGMRAVLAPAVVLTGVLYVVLVQLLGFQESGKGVQRVSSGYGVRQLGVSAWLLAHAVYLAVLVLVLPSAVAVVSRARQRRRRPATHLRGD
jgi:hypothetical protein